MIRTVVRRIAGKREVRRSCFVAKILYTFFFFLIFADFADTEVPAFDILLFVYDLMPISASRIRFSHICLGFVARSNCDSGNFDEGQTEFSPFISRHSSHFASLFTQHLLWHNICVNTGCMRVTRIVRRMSWRDVFRLLLSLCSKSQLTKGAISGYGIIEMSHALAKWYQFCRNFDKDQLIHWKDRVNCAQNLKLQKFLRISMTFPTY